jgi:hypothetical protein
VVAALVGTVIARDGSAKTKSSFMLLFSVTTLMRVVFLTVALTELQ